MDDLTKELWQGVAERASKPEPVYLPPLLRTEPPRPVADKTGWRGFLVPWKLGAMLALACILGVLGIVSADPFAAASVSERVAAKLGQPATCTADASQTIYRCTVVAKNTHRSIQCFAVSGRDIRQISGKRDLGC